MITHSSPWFTTARIWWHAALRQKVRQRCGWLITRAGINQSTSRRLFWGGWRNTFPFPSSGVATSLLKLNRAQVSLVLYFKDVKLRSDTSNAVFKRQYGDVSLIWIMTLAQIALADTRKEKQRQKQWTSGTLVNICRLETRFNKFDTSINQNLTTAHFV